jgi:predicted GIY-YIG superfamily endonuclease
MSPQYIPYLLMAVSFVNGAGICALTLGAYYLRGWERERQSARREREQSWKRGVYWIRNTTNGSLYIGSTTRSFAARWGEHIGDLEAGTHPIKALQRDWHVYGPDAFAFDIIDVMDDEDAMRAREKEWIALARRKFPKYQIYNGVAFYRDSPHRPADTA